MSGSPVRRVSPAARGPALVVYVLRRRAVPGPALASRSRCRRAASTAGGSGRGWRWSPSRSRSASLHRLAAVRVVTDDDGVDGGQRRTPAPAGVGADRRRPALAGRPVADARLSDDGQALAGDGRGAVGGRWPPSARRGLRRRYGSRAGSRSPTVPRGIATRPDRCGARTDHSPRRRGGRPIGCRGDRDVAQLGSALDWGSRGRRFKSCRPDRKGPGQRHEPLAWPSSLSRLTPMLTPTAGGKPHRHHHAVPFHHLPGPVR